MSQAQKSRQKHGVSSKVKQEIKKAIIAFEKKDVETKQFPGSSSSEPTTMDTNALYLMTDIPKGTGQGQRIGDQVYLKHLDVRLKLRNGRYHSQPLPGQINVTWRVMAFQYKEKTVAGVGPTINDLLIASNANPAGVLKYSPYCARNTDFLNIYTVLYDKYFSTANQTDNGANGAYSIYETEKMVHFRIPLKYAKRKIEFIDGTTIDSTNHIYIAVINDANQAVFHSAPYYPDFFIQSTTAYTDE